MTLVEILALLKPAVAGLALALFWTWETVHPLASAPHRWRHARRNLSITLINVLALMLAFGVATVAVADWTTRQGWGLLNQSGFSAVAHLLVALLLLDGWLYLWHRLNHRLPWLWRFHRMHHSDPAMDVTTATRFHLGEQATSALLRLGLIPLLGVTLAELLISEMLVLAVTMFHHANISLGRADRLLRWLLVTPRMHQIHHSRLRRETDSNYAVLLSFWDRLAGTFRMRAGKEPIRLGLDDWDADRWQTVSGMLRTPFTTAEQVETAPTETSEGQNCT